MYKRILLRIRKCVLQKNYVMTLHANEEAEEDALTIFDIERAALSGQVIEKQLDNVWNQAKYRLRGVAIDGSEIEIIVRFGATGKLIMITVYRV